MHQHNRQVHWYCESCRRTFQSEHGLDMHLNTSAIHNPRQHVCPGRGCGRAFVAYGDLALHLESGACPSGFNRRNINDTVIRADRQNIITNPSRLIGYREDAPVTRTWATANSWNGFAYECILCHKEFRQLSALNAHLESPAHEDRIYRCPAQYNGCSSEYRTLSGLLSHVERSECGVTRFRRRMTDTLDDITSRMRRIAV